MKGGLVAQAFAALALHEAGIRLSGDLVLMAVVGEEAMEHELGTTACVQRGYRADAAIVAEPSAPPVPLAVIPVTPGVMRVRIEVEGRAGHPGMRGETIHAGGAGAAAGVNAIDKAVLLYSALRQLEEDWGLTKIHPLFRPGQFALHPGVLRGSPRGRLEPFVIADQAILDYIVIYPPDEEPAAVREEIEQQLDAASRLDHWLRRHPPRVDWVHHWPPSDVDPGHPIVAATRRAHEMASGLPAVIQGWTAVHDGTFLNAAGIPAISYGPGDVRVAHTVNEHVAIDEVIVAAKVFALLALTWCNDAELTTSGSGSLS
jgi:acetylornithine deacetylase